MDYLKLSDFEINKLVLFKQIELGVVEELYRLNASDSVDVVKNTWDKCDGDCGVIAVMRYTNGGYNPFGGAHDYCNNPADAWPIILDNRIAIEPSGMGCILWSTNKRDEDGNLLHTTYSENPLRAAMILFLRMQEVLND